MVAGEARAARAGLKTLTNEQKKHERTLLVTAGDGAPRTLCDVAWFIAQLPRLGGSALAPAAQRHE